MTQTDTEDKGEAAEDKGEAAKDTQKQSNGGKLEHLMGKCPILTMALRIRPKCCEKSKSRLSSLTGFREKSMRLWARLILRCMLQ